MEMYRLHACLGFARQTAYQGQPWGTGPTFLVQRCTCSSQLLTEALLLLVMLQIPIGFLSYCQTELLAIITTSCSVNIFEKFNQVCESMK